MFLIGLILFFPKKYFFSKKFEIIKFFKNQLPFILIILAVVTFHLFEVNVLDPRLSVGDYTNNIKNFEGDIVYWFSQHWTPILIYFFVLMYIAVYPFTLWFSPLYFLLTNNKKAMKTLAYGLLLIYVIVLPFYLFLPVTNVYTYYNVGSALETTIPTVENFFYSTTTQNNCLPSLHTSITILIAYSVSLTGNKKMTYFTYFTMLTVITGVIYLSIHWITDVVTGALISVGVIFILRKFIREEELNEQNRKTGS